MPDRSVSTPERGEAARLYIEEGYALGPVVFPPELLARVNAAMDAVMAGEYETGQKPLDEWWTTQDDPAKKLRKIDQPQLANRTILEFLRWPALGEAIASIVGADFIQAWAVQLLHKPGGGAPASTVGWHQDYQYWQTWWTPDSEVFTAWVAVSDVGEDSGPMCFVAGSHRWGLLEGGDFFGVGLDEQRHDLRGIPEGAAWNVVPATMPAGAFSLHHRLTLHGSYPNTSRAPRRSFAIHVRTANSTPTPGSEGYDYVSYLEDHDVSPVLYEKASAWKA